MLVYIREAVVVVVVAVVFVVVVVVVVVVAGPLVSRRACHVHLVYAYSGVCEINAHPLHPGRRRRHTPDPPTSMLMFTSGSRPCRDVRLFRSRSGLPFKKKCAFISQRVKPPLRVRHNIEMGERGRPVSCTRLADVRLFRRHRDADAT